MSQDPKVILFPSRTRAGSPPAFYRWPVHMAANVTLEHFIHALHAAGFVVRVDSHTGAVFIQRDGGDQAA